MHHRALAWACGFSVSLVLLLLATALDAWAQPRLYRPIEIAIEGRHAPGTGDLGSYSRFGVPSLNNSGDVAFWATISGGTAPAGIFLDSGGIQSAVVLEGDPAPGAGASFGPVTAIVSLNDSGDVTFSARIIGGTAPAGIFLDSGGIQSAVALTGDPAPGTAGGTYGSFGRAILNDSGEVAFLAGVEGTSDGICIGGAFEGDSCSNDSDCGPPEFPGFCFSAGVFMNSGGTHRAIAIAGDLEPRGGACAYSGFGSPSPNDSGDVAFKVDLVTCSNDTAIILDSGGTQRTVAIRGDPAPGTGGETYLGVGSPSLNESRNIAFIASFSTGGPTASEGLFIDSGGTQSDVVLAGDPAPPLNGGSFESFDISSSGTGGFLNDFGDVAFEATISGGTADGGIFVAYRGEAVSVPPGPQIVSLLGGSLVPGGIDIVLDSSGGTLVAWNADRLSDSERIASFDLGLGILYPPLTWFVEFDGDLNGPATIYFRYDDSGFPETIDEEQLTIFHVAEDGSAESGGTVDPFINSIEFTFRAFSTFALAAPQCNDGLDNDGDGLVDAPNDGDCTSAGDLSEVPDCADGLDNDGDGEKDVAEDAGCFDAVAPIENPACDDGINNGDGDILIDFPADPGCVAAWDGSEVDPPLCGLGYELALLLPPLMWLHRRRRPRAP